MALHNELKIERSPEQLEKWFTEAVSFLQEAKIAKAENIGKLVRYSEHIEGIVCILRELSSKRWVLEIKELITQANFEKFLLYREYAQQIAEKLQLKLTELRKNLISHPITYLEHPNNFQSLLDEVIDNVCQDQKVAFLMGSKPQQYSIGHVSSAFFKNPMFDMNTVSEIFDFLTVSPKPDSTVKKLEKT